MNTEREGNTISVEAFEQLVNTLNQIATDMNSIKKILNDAIPDGTYNHRCEAIELFANRSGALADDIAKTLGEPEFRGSLEEWFDA